MPEECRSRIVAGAYRALVRNGYQATSVKDIAEEARVAPGLIHYYFKSKEDLLVAAVRDSCASQARLTEGADPAQGVKDGLSARRDFNRLFFCMLGVGLHNPSIAGAVRDFVREQRAHLEGLVREEMTRRGGDEADAPAIAAAFWGGLIGTMIQDLLDPDFKADAAIDALTRMAFGRESQAPRGRVAGRPRA